MAGAIRYRCGLNAETGALLVGAEHLAQSLETIWMTDLDVMPMLLSFGTRSRRALAEDVTPALALWLYNELIGAAMRWEPEYAFQRMQLVLLTQDGALGLRHDGIYYPEGRFGNFDISQSLSVAATRLGGILR